jgi:hypothetical protein
MSLNEGLIISLDELDLGFHGYTQGKRQKLEHLKVASSHGSS